MFVFCGLGNPGGQYALNRHNVGFLAADVIHKRHNFPAWRNKFQADLSEGRIGSEKVLLVKPQTYMNKSGDALRALVQFYKLKPKQILVVYDELDLAPGKIRLKVGGGHGGHNGIRSIAQHISPDFRRLRIGIGHPGSKDAVTPWVLGDFSKAEREFMGPVLDAISENLDLLIAGDDGSFSNKIHLSTGHLLPNVPGRGAHKGNAQKADEKDRLKSTKSQSEASTQEPASQPNTQSATPASALAEGLMNLFKRS